jgi:hypothetical protein
LKAKYPKPSNEEKAEIMGNSNCTWKHWTACAVISILIIVIAVVASTSGGKDDSMIS